MRLYSMTKGLEVIVTSAKEALEAQEGGADRLELVHSLDEEGLTPSPEVVEDVMRVAHVPVRVILRDSPALEIVEDHEITRLITKAKTFVRMNVEGLVLGFLGHREVNVDCLKHLFTAVPQVRVTFHRAFEHVQDPLRAILQLKAFPQIDRILTNGGDGSWEDRAQRLREWQNAAAPELKIVVGGGLTQSVLSALAREPGLTEFHAGRAARTPPLASGILSRAQVAALKNALA